MTPSRGRHVVLGGPIAAFDSSGVVHLLSSPIDRPWLRWCPCRTANLHRSAAAPDLLPLVVTPLVQYSSCAATVHLQCSTVFLYCFLQLKPSSILKIVPRYNFDEFIEFLPKGLKPFKIQMEFKLVFFPKFSIQILFGI
jgi:hypothetical protein